MLLFLCFQPPPAVEPQKPQKPQESAMEELKGILVLGVLLPASVCNRIIVVFTFSDEFH